QPLRFFGAFAALFLLTSLFFMTPVLIEYGATGRVPRLPTWVLSVALLLLSVLAMASGLILDSVSRGRAEQKRIFYLSLPAGSATLRQERPLAAAPPRKPNRAA